ncbi:MAG TPA: sigma factor-like helix-turn-helix DNA-binding protein, partial [Mycobacteriales bacterium]|nr:sigma factor-like helix-turn-helix DNA-binding protein [Mycobacteriales bacterium]
MRDEQGFADFTAARSEALRRQAYLLTGSEGRASRVTERALAETGRRWSRLGSAAAAEEHARRSVAGLALRSRGTAPAVAATPLGTALPTEDAGEAVWRALAGLPPRRRAVLVLRYDEGLSDAAAGARLGIPAATAAAEAEAGLGTLRSLLRRRGRPEDLLPTALATRHPTPAGRALASGAPGRGFGLGRRRRRDVGGRASTRARAHASEPRSDRRARRATAR